MLQNLATLHCIQGAPKKIQVQSGQLFHTLLSPNRKCHFSYLTFLLSDKIVINGTYFGVNLRFPSPLWKWLVCSMFDYHKKSPNKIERYRGMRRIFGLQFKRVQRAGAAQNCPVHPVVRLVSLGNFSYHSKPSIKDLM